MKKIHLVLIIILAALIILGVYLLNTANKTQKGMPESIQEETVVEETVQAENEVKNEEEVTQTEENIKQDSDKKETVLQKTENKIRKWQHKISGAKTSAENVKTEQEKTLINESVQKTSKFTPEEEELLKKIPRSDEVVVDKEIKVKSSGRYTFK